MNTKVYIAIFMLAVAHLGLGQLREPTRAESMAYTKMKHKALRYDEGAEARYWKSLAEEMIKEVECIPLVGGRENRKYNRWDDPSTTVNDPERYWYS